MTADLTLVPPPSPAEKVTACSAEIAAEALGIVARDCWDDLEPHERHALSVSKRACLRIAAGR